MAENNTIGVDDIQLPNEFSTMKRKHGWPDLETKQKLYLKFAEKYLELENEFDDTERGLSFYKEIIEELDKAFNNPIWSYKLAQAGESRLEVYHLFACLEREGEIRYNNLYFSERQKENKYWYKEIKEWYANENERGNYLENMSNLAILKVFIRYGLFDVKAFVNHFIECYEEWQMNNCQSQVFKLHSDGTYSVNIIDRNSPIYLTKND